jgi:hypothetical protein
MSTSGNILVDLDGTLAHYAGWQGASHIGEPIAPMVKKVKRWLEQGTTVKIFTARANTPECIPHIRAWLDKHGLEGVKEITATKDMATSEIHDDRAFSYKINTGICREHLMAYQLAQVAKALGIKVDANSTADQVTVLCTASILKMDNALEVAKAQIDSANDALSYVKITESGGPLSDLNRAKSSVAKAHKIISEL